MPSLPGRAGRCQRSPLLSPLIRALRQELRNRGALAAGRAAAAAQSGLRQEDRAPANGIRDSIGGPAQGPRGTPHLCRPRGTTSASRISPTPPSAGWLTPSTHSQGQPGPAFLSAPAEYAQKAGLTQRSWERRSSGSKSEVLQHAARLHGMQRWQTSLRILPQEREKHTEQVPLQKDRESLSH